MTEYKIAVLSDIHSNYTALKAVMDDIKKEGVDKIIAAGDIIGGFPNPNEVIELLLESRVSQIHGNREDYLRNYLDGKHSYWDEYHQMLPVVWTNNNLTDYNKNYILSLPTHLEFKINNTSFKVVHGSPRKINELIYKHESDKIEEALACAKEDVLICGHCHQQWHNTVNNTLIVNPGSVGISYIKGAMAPYSLIYFEDDSWKVREKVIPYNAHNNLSAFNEAGIDYYKPWENMLMHSIIDGKVATLAFLRYAKKYAETDRRKDKFDLIPNEHWHRANETFNWDSYQCVWARIND